MLDYEHVPINGTDISGDCELKEYKFVLIVLPAKESKSIMNFAKV